MTYRIAAAMTTNISNLFNTDSDKNTYLLKKFALTYTNSVAKRTCEICI